jgi:hypothetical protein
MEVLSAGVFGKSIECPKPGESPWTAPMRYLKEFRSIKGLVKSERYSKRGTTALRSG